MTHLDTNALFTQYVNVVNKALGENRDKIPYQQIIKASEKALAGKNLGVAVYKEDPDTPHDYFTIQYSNGTFDIVEHGKTGPDMSWKVSEEHLDHVVRDPQTYIDSPAKLDLDWLKTRVGV